MKPVPGTSSFAALALMAGVALAALCKLIYDFFNGYAIVPNLLIELGLAPSAVLLETLTFIGIASPAFLVGHALLKKVPGESGRYLLACALPWFALCTWGLVGGLFSERSGLLHELTGTSALSFSAPLLTLLAVPVGLWLAYRGKR
jgi:hypothetical protein